MAKKAVIRNQKLEWDPIPADNAAKGKCLEDAIEIAYKLRFEELGIPYERNHSNGIGPDFWIGKDTITEAKNWAVYPMTPAMYDRSVKSRFTDSDPEQEKYRILIISQLTCASEVRRKIKGDSIEVIQLGFEVQDNRQSKRRAARFIYKKLKKKPRLFTNVSAINPRAIGFEFESLYSVYHSARKHHAKMGFYVMSHHWKKIGDDLYSFIETEIQDFPHAVLLIQKYDSGSKQEQGEVYSINFGDEEQDKTRNLTGPYTPSKTTTKQDKSPM